MVAFLWGEQDSNYKLRDPVYVTILKCLKP